MCHEHARTPHFDGADFDGAEFDGTGVDGPA
jgi:hypothetical protein